LVIYTLLNLAVYKLSSLTPYGITLTLAGIAGLILSIGMAVDANILIFERMKEEARHGKSRATSIELGFAHAWTSIRDSNVSTLITCVILYTFGTGIIRGFALVLAIGVVISMFSAITVTRTFLRLLYKS
jgi:preprotein translocase subunit SecD